MKLPIRILIWCAALLVASSAHAVRITPAHSGSWFDPAFDKQGLNIQVLDKAGEGPERIVAVYWFTYDDAGVPVWALGVGTTERDTVTMTMQRAFGGARPPAEQTASEMIDWAEMTLEFGTCNTAVADFTMVDSGEVGRYDLQRLTRIGARTCSGGISDDAEPGDDEITLVAQLEGGLPPEGGLLRFKLRPAFASFDVDVRGVVPGSYSVRVGGVDEGELIAEQRGQGIARGSLRFVSGTDDDEPSEDEEMTNEGETPEEGEDASDSDATAPLLDFDPRGQLIEIVDAEGVTVLSATFPSDADDSDDDSDDSEDDEDDEDDEDEGDGEG